MKNLKNKKGMAALLIVIIMGAIAVSTVVTITAVNLDRLEGGVHLGERGQLLYNAESCLENALLILSKNWDNTVSSEQMNSGSIECSFSISQNGEERQISSQADIGSYSVTIEETVEEVLEKIYIKNRIII